MDSNQNRVVATFESKEDNIIDANSHPEVLDFGDENEPATDKSDDKSEVIEFASEEEREAYIGIYRLLNNIQKSNGAAVGHVLQANREMTLNNLLSAVVTAKNGRMDTQVDENSGLTELKYTREPLILQLNEIFNDEQQAEDETTDNKEKYFEFVINEMIEEITPSKLAKTIVDTGNAKNQMEQFMDKSVEQILEEWKMPDENEEIDAEYEGSHHFSYENNHISQKSM